MAVSLSAPYATSIHTNSLVINIQASADPKVWRQVSNRIWAEGFPIPDFYSSSGYYIRPEPYTFSKMFSGLIPGTTYYFQFRFAYPPDIEISSIGTADTHPLEVETSFAQNITDTSATLYGRIWSDSPISVSHIVTVIDPITSWSRDFKLSYLLRVPDGWLTTSVNANYLQANTRYLYRSRVVVPPHSRIFYGAWRSFRTGIYKISFRAFAVGPDQKHYYGEWKSFDRPL